MGKFSGVLLVTDLDGTLYDDKKQISAPTMAALDHFQKEGGLFTAATGRVYKTFYGIREGLPVNAPVILANGAMLYDYADKRIFYENNLDPNAAEATKDIHAHFPETGVEIYTFDHTYIIGFNDISADHMKRFKIEYTKIKKFEDVPMPWTKALFTVPADRGEALDRYARKNWPQYSFMFSLPVFYEMVNAGVSKGKAVLQLADMMGISHGRICTAGDNTNDLDMLEVGAFSFAPENGHPLAKQKAKFILPDNNHHTIAALIKQMEGILHGCI